MFGVLLENASWSDCLRMLVDALCSSRSLKDWWAGYSRFRMPPPGWLLVLTTRERRIPPYSESGGIPHLFGTSLSPHIGSAWRARHDNNNDLAQHCDQITPMLHPLHWLPSVDCKVTPLDRRSLSVNLPLYLADGCHLIADAHERRLCSTESRACVVTCDPQDLWWQSLCSCQPQTLEHFISISEMRTYCSCGHWRHFCCRCCRCCWWRWTKDIFV